MENLNKEISNEADKSLKYLYNPYFDKTGVFSSFSIISSIFLSSCTMCTSFLCTATTSSTSSTSMKIATSVA